MASEESGPWVAVELKKEQEKLCRLWYFLNGRVSNIVLEKKI